MFFLARSRTAQYVVRYLINCTKRSMGRFPNEKTGNLGIFPTWSDPSPQYFRQIDQFFGHFFCQPSQPCCEPRWPSF